MALGVAWLLVLIGEEKERFVQGLAEGRQQTHKEEGLALQRLCPSLFLAWLLTLSVYLM